MSTSLSKIKSQIAKLQKQAATIESGIVARIKAEIAKHGLTSEQLFGSSSDGAGNRAVAKPQSTAKAGATKPAKFADGVGNTWVGMGKRPQWLRDALEAGQSLDDFLVAGKKSAPAKSKPAVKAVPATRKAAKKPALKKRAAAKEAAPAKAGDASAAAKRPAKAAAKKNASKRPATVRPASAAVEPSQKPEA